MPAKCLALASGRVEIHVLGKQEILPPSAQLAHVRDILNLEDVPAVLDPQVLSAPSDDVSLLE